MQTRLVDLVLNLLRKAQYQGTTPSADELYLVTDDYGVTSADVTNALGYTPYNATNPNGYITATALANLANTDFSNLTDTADIYIAHAAMPSDTYEALTWGATGTTYTAPADGWFYAQARFTGAVGAHYILLSTSGTGMAIRSGMYNANTATVVTDQINLPVRKGATVTLNYGSASGQTMDNNYIRFCYAVGSESEAT